MNDNFLSELNKIERIISLSIDIDEAQKSEWLEMINSFKASKSFDLKILTAQIASIDMNVYDIMFQKKIKELSRKNIIAYTTLALNYKQNKTLDNALLFLEYFNANIYKAKPTYIEKVKKLKEKKGLLGVRQRSLGLSREKILSNRFSNEVQLEKLKMK